MRPCPDTVAWVALTAAAALCLCYIKSLAFHDPGASPLILRKLEAESFEDELSEGSGRAALMKLTLRPGLGGILFGKSKVAMRLRPKPEDRVFGRSGAGDISAKERPLGFYFQKDIPKDLKHDAGVTSNADGTGKSSLELLQQVARHKAKKTGDVSLGFYFSKDIPEDVKAKPGPPPLQQQHQRAP